MAKVVKHISKNLFVKLEWEYAIDGMPIGSLVDEPTKGTIFTEDIDCSGISIIDRIVLNTKWNDISNNSEDLWELLPIKIVVKCIYYV